MKKVFVTGITGLLGTNLTIALLREGYTVVGLVRDKNRYKGIITKNLFLVEKSLDSDLTQELKDCNYVIHIAANTNQNEIAYKNYYKINTLATQKLYEQANKAKIKRFIFISTANTVGYGQYENTYNESVAWKYPHKKSLYAFSKKQAEDWLLKNQKSTEIIILNPTFMLGAYDTKPSSGKIILMSLNKSIVFYPKGGKNFIYINDVVKAIISSFNKGKVGERYVLANENLTYKEFFKQLKALTNQKQLLIPIPISVLKVVGLIGEVLKFFKVKTALSLSNMNALCIHNYYMNYKSIKDFNLTYTPIEKAIKEAVDYFENK